MKAQGKRLYTGTKFVAQGVTFVLAYLGVVGILTYAVVDAAGYLT